MEQAWRILCEHRMRTRRFSCRFITRQQDVGLADGGCRSTLRRKDPVLKTLLGQFVSHTVPSKR